MKKIEYRLKYLLFFCILLCLPFIIAYNTYPEFENNMLHEKKQLQPSNHMEVNRKPQTKLTHLYYFQKDGIDGNYDIFLDSTTRKLEGVQLIDIEESTDTETISKIVKKEKQHRINKLEVQTDSIQVGTISEDVKDVQEILQSFGYYKGEIDGIYGPLTKQALQVAENIHDIELVEEAPLTSIASKSDSNQEEKNTIEIETNSENVHKKEDTANKQVETTTNTNIIETAKAFIGTPYVWGGTSTSGFDCSGFIQYVFNIHGHSIPRTVNDIWNYSTPVDSPAVGDLVFFETYKTGPSHLGIYLGDGDFIHAGANDGVTISNVNNPYWNERYIGSKTIR